MRCPFSIRFVGKRFAMARLPRLIIGNLPHLVSQRAQHGQGMVRDDTDRAGLLRLLREVSIECRVKLYAYAMLEARLDLVACPADAAGLSRMMQAVARRHAAAFNRRHGRIGGLWEGRFRAAVLEPPSWLLHCMVYVEQLAAAAPFGAIESRWSSEAHHCGLKVDPLLSDPAEYWALGNTPFEREAQYRARREQGLTSIQLARIEAALRGGWVLGSEPFAAALPLTEPRPTAPRPRGRPPKRTAY
jgi:putative transposase